MAEPGGKKPQGHGFRKEGLRRAGRVDNRANTRRKCGGLAMV